MKSAIQLLFVILSPLTVFAEITLVRDGKPQAVIIVPTVKTAALAPSCP